MFNYFEIRKYNYFATSTSYNTIIFHLRGVFLRYYECNRQVDVRRAKTHGRWFGIKITIVDGRVGALSVCTAALFRCTERGPHPSRTSASQEQAAAGGERNGVGSLVGCATRAGWSSLSFRLSLSRARCRSYSSKKENAR